MNESAFELIDWTRLASCMHRGETGSAHERAIVLGGLRVRLVEYSQGYVPDHWCERGHLVLLLKGDLAIRFADGSECHVSQGMACKIAASAERPHQALRRSGATAFILD